VLFVFLPNASTSLTSYLLFDRAFCRALIELGVRDTLARRGDGRA
jgi:hypothetical protein